MFIQGVNREAGATRAIALVKPGTAPATVNERGMGSVNPPRRMDQTATAPQAWEGGSIRRNATHESGDRPCCEINRNRYGVAWGDMSMQIRTGTSSRANRLPYRGVPSSPAYLHPGTHDTRGMCRDESPGETLCDFLSGLVIEHAADHYKRSPYSLASAALLLHRQWQNNPRQCGKWMTWW